MDQFKMTRESISKHILYWVEMNESLSVYMHHYELCLYPLIQVPPPILYNVSELLVTL